MITILKINNYHCIIVNTPFCCYFFGRKYPKLYSQFKTPEEVSDVLNLQDCLNEALLRNLNIKNDSLHTEKAGVLRKTAFSPEKTNFSLEQDPTEGGSSGNAISIVQTFDWPGVYVQQAKVFRQQSLLSEKLKLRTRSEVIKAVKLNYYHYAYQHEKHAVLQYLDSIYLDFSQKAELRYGTGETNRLEVLSAQNKLKENEILLLQTESEMAQYILALKELMNRSKPFSLQTDSLKPIAWKMVQDSKGINQNPEQEYFRQNILVAGANIKLAKAKLGPDVSIGYSQQYLVNGFNPAEIERNYFPETRIAGFQVGISLPLFARSYSAGIKAEKIERAIAENQLATNRLHLQTRWQQALRDFEKYTRALNYYQNSGLDMAKEQIRIAQVSFEKGAIGYIAYIQNLSQATDAQLNYLAVIHQLNTVVIEMQYLQGNGSNNQ